MPCSDSGNEGLFFHAQPPGAVAEHLAEEDQRRADADECPEHGKQLRRSSYGYLRVAADDNRVAVVAGVAPTPAGRILDAHEGRDLVEGVVHPVRLECRAVSRFVPAGAGGRGVEDAVDREGEHGPPSAPEHESADAGTENQREPKERVTDGGTVPPFEKLAHFVPWHGRGIPRRFGKALLNGRRRVSADEAVIVELVFVHGEDCGGPSRPIFRLRQGIRLPLRCGRRYARR